MVAWILIGLLILVIAAVPVAAVLGILSFVLDEIAMDGRLTLGIGEIVWDKSKEFILVAVHVHPAWRDYASGWDCAPYVWRSHSMAVLAPWRPHAR